jgi:hypothetical protein
MVFRKLLGSPSRPRVGPVTGPLHTPLNRLGGVVYAESRASGGVRAGGLLMDVVLPGGMMDGLQRPSFGQQHLCVRDRWAGGSQGGSAAPRGKVLRNARALAVLAENPSLVPPGPMAASPACFSTPFGCTEAHCDPPWAGAAGGSTQCRVSDRPLLSVCSTDRGAVLGHMNAPWCVATMCQAVFGGVQIRP